MHPTTQGPRQDPSRQSGNFKPSIKKLVQNYSKMLHDLVSNPQHPHHKRTSSEYVSIYSRYNDQSSVNKSNIQTHQRNNSQSRSPIPSTRQPAKTKVNQSNDLGSVRKKVSSSRLNTSLNKSALSNSQERSLSKQPLQTNTSTKKVHHVKAASIDVNNYGSKLYSQQQQQQGSQKQISQSHRKPINTTSNTHRTEEEQASIIKPSASHSKKVSATPYFKLISSHRKSPSFQVSSQKKSKNQLDDPNKSSHSIINDISSILYDQSKGQAQQNLQAQNRPLSSGANKGTNYYPQRQVSNSNNQSQYNLNQRKRSQPADLSKYPIYSNSPYVSNRDVLERRPSANLYKRDEQGQQQQQQNQSKQQQKQQQQQQAYYINDSNAVKRGNYVSQEDENSTNLSQQIRDNYKNSLHTRNPTEEGGGLNKSIQGHKRNISAIDFDRGQSPIKTEGSSQKVSKNPALNSIYKKVGKYLNRPHGSQPDIQTDARKATEDYQNNSNVSKNNVSQVHFRSNSGEQKFRKNSYQHEIENEKTQKPYLFHDESTNISQNIMIHDLSAQKVSQSKQNGNKSRDISPGSASKDTGFIIKPNVLREKNQQQPSQKKLAKIIDKNNNVSTQMVMDDALKKQEQRMFKEKIASHSKQNNYSMQNEESYRAYINLREGGGAEKKSERQSSNSPAFFKDGHRKERSSSPYDHQRARDNNGEVSPIYNPNQRGNSQPNIYNLNKGAFYINAGGQDRATRQKVTDESRNSSVSKLNISNNKTDNSQIRGDNNPTPVSNKKPSHKRNSKSVSSVNQLDVLIKGLNLPINANRLNKENNITPNGSEPNSQNASVADLKSVDISNISRRNSQANQPPPDSEELNDDEILKQRLVKTVGEHFKGKNSCPHTTLDYYRLIKMIGKGAFGKVYLGVHLMTGKYVAIKSIEKSYMKDEASKRKVFQEVLILRKTNHKNIIRLLEVFENKKYLFMVLEYAANLDLLGLVKKKGRLHEDEAKRIFGQITAGIRYCHHTMILHRDVKLDNILLDENMNVKICDFGVSRFVKKGQIINEQCGTPAYIAPEIIKEEGYEGCYADLWSMGVLLYAITTGTVPFKANNLDELHDAIIKGYFVCPGYLSEDLKDLIHRLIRVNPYDRISVDDIGDHPWLKNRMETDDKFPMNDTKSNSSMERSYNKKSYSLEQGNTIQIIEPVLQEVVKLGYPRDFIIKSVNLNSCNHTAACYYLIYKSYQDQINQINAATAIN